MLVTKEERRIAFYAKCDRMEVIRKRMKEIELNEKLMNKVDNCYWGVNNFQEQRRAEEAEYLALIEELDVLRS